MAMSPEKDCSDCSVWPACRATNQSLCREVVSGLAKSRHIMLRQTILDLYVRFRKRVIIDRNGSIEERRSLGAFDRPSRGLRW
jgi:hypothetical protein